MRNTNAKVFTGRPKLNRTPRHQPITAGERAPVMFGAGLREERRETRKPGPVTIFDFRDYSHML